jgi:hypothetical protein
MRLPNAAIAVLAGVLATTAPTLADSVAVTSGPNGSVIVNGKPCRVVATHDGSGSATTSNSTSITAGPNGVSGSTTVSPGDGSSSSVVVGSGSSSNGTQSSSAASSDCVIYRNEQ